MTTLVAFNIGFIQVALLILTFLVWFCELTPLFANTLKSALLRFLIAMSLLILGFYASYLMFAPPVVVFCIFVVTIASTYLTISHIIHEYTTRKQKQEWLSNIKDRSCME